MKSKESTLSQNHCFQSINAGKKEGTVMQGECEPLSGKCTGRALMLNKAGFKFIRMQKDICWTYTPRLETQIIVLTNLAHKVILKMDKGYGGIKLLDHDRFVQAY